MPGRVFSHSCSISNSERSEVDTHIWSGSECPSRECKHRQECRRHTIQSVAILKMLKRPDFAGRRSQGSLRPNRSSQALLRCRFWTQKIREPLSLSLGHSELVITHGGGINFVAQLEL